MKKFTTLFLALLIAVFGASTASATVDLFDWAFNVNGTTYEALDAADSADPVTSGFLPSDFNDSSFDWYTGLGTLSITYNPGAAGSYYLLSFFDHEIDEAINTYFNEYGAVGGTAAAGQSWEIDEPGYMFGDIYDHVTDPVTHGFLDNTNGVPSLYPDDVSMAMGWNFTLNAGEYAVITHHLGGLNTASGIVLQHHDPDSSAMIEFYSTLSIEGGGPPVEPIPEPGTMILLGTGLAGLAGLRRRKSKK